MKLVFALILQTLNGDGYYGEKETYGYWENLQDCVWYGQTITTQGKGKYRIPILAYCEPTFVDESITEIF